MEICKIVVVDNGWLCSNRCFDVLKFCEICRTNAPLFASSRVSGRKSKCYDCQQEGVHKGELEVGIPPWVRGDHGIVCEAVHDISVLRISP